MNKDNRDEGVGEDEGEGFGAGDIGADVEDGVEDGNNGGDEDPQEPRTTLHSMELSSDGDTPAANRSIFSIHAADISSELRAKTRLTCLRLRHCFRRGEAPDVVVYRNGVGAAGDNPDLTRGILLDRPDPKTSEHYKKSRTEFLFYACFFGMLAGIGLVMAGIFLVEVYGPWWSAIHSEKWKCGQRVTASGHYPGPSDRGGCWQQRYRHQQGSASGAATIEPATDDDRYFGGKPRTFAQRVKRFFED